ncbi:hypothetical protein HAHE_22690 [Haloferula helveola]|uniref:DUF5658 domain-containing protein n=1 Tax=Haloferula helveola TaxID=490095 RepID=A0ABM7RMJ0_9BACT|nr:hypothetical protein HAHE_22690 [Haloferula helveola]
MLEDRINAARLREAVRRAVLPSVLALADVIATLLGQPAAYWQGDLQAATDANPLVVRALRFSPWLSIPGWLAWVGMIVTFMLAAAPVWRVRALVFLCLAHLCFVWAWVLKWNLVAGLSFSLVAFWVTVLMRHQIHRVR